MNRNYAYIKFTGTGNVSLITQLLNLEPSLAWNLGDRRSDGSIYNFSNWSYENNDFEKEQLDEAITEILIFVESNIGRFKQIPNCFALTIQCVGYHKSTFSGFYLSKQLIERLSTIGAAVDFDLYCRANSSE